MRATRIFETCLYVSDLGAAERFYTGVMGLQVVSRFPPRGIALRCGAGALLLFDPQRSRTSEMVPGHGTEGAGHVAFLATAEELPGWRRHLAAAGVAIEAEHDWPEGGRSIYFRDPAGNSVELAPPDIWNGLGFAAAPPAPDV